MGRIASFHLIREEGVGAALQIRRVGLDRRELSHTPGLAFWRLLGTGAGSSTGLGADLRRRALFAVWDDELSLDVFLASSPVARRWRRAAESWHVRLASLGGHGTWRGFDVPDGIEPVPGGARRFDGPVAMITRADVRLRTWREFAAAAKVVDGELQRADGLLAVVGVGEAPIGRQGTFSVWRSLDDARQFAYSMPEHRRVIGQTRSGDWYGEEMFARFAVLSSSGTWDGVDPTSR